MGKKSKADVASCGDCGRLYGDEHGKQSVPAAFMSGPIKSVDQDLMHALLCVENMREQIE